ncbi:MAG: ferritin-like domain-containing protein [Terriglobales bacterium]
MQTAHELFIHELNDMLDAEQQIVNALQQLENESERPDLQKAFSQHRGQTEKQIERLHQCFEEIDEQPKEQECLGIRGIIGEKQKLEEEDPSDEIKEIFSIGASTKVEHYEIAAYNGLIDMAQKMGHKQSVRLLQQNLREEEQMLKKCESLLKKLKPSMMGMEEEEMEEAPRSRTRRAA